MATADFLSISLPKNNGGPAFITIKSQEESCKGLGEKIVALSSLETMSAQQWQVLLEHYIDKNHRNIDMENFKFQCKGDECVLHLQERDRVADLDMLYYMLCSVFDKPQKLYDYVSEHGDTISWV